MQEDFNDYWLLDKNAKEMSSDSYVYVFVRLGKSRAEVEFYIVPSQFVAKNTWKEKYGESWWYSFTLKQAIPFKDKWDVFLKTE